MTKKVFEAFAFEIRSIREHGGLKEDGIALMENLCIKVFEKANPVFDINRFLKACEVK